MSLLQEGVVIAKNMSLLQDLTQDGKKVLYLSYKKNKEDRIMKVEKKQSFTEKVLAHVRRVAEKNAGIPSSKGMFEAQVPTKLREVRNPSQAD